MIRLHCTYVLLVCSFHATVQAASIYVEAESGSVAAVAGTPGWSVIADSGASGGQALSSMVDTAEDTTNGQIDDAVTLSVNFLEAGDYFLYARIRVPSPGGPDNEIFSRNDSFFVPVSFNTFDFSVAEEISGAKRALNFGSSADDKTSGNNSVLNDFGWVGITRKPSTGLSNGIDNTNTDVILAGSNGPNPYVVPAAGTYAFDFVGREDGLQIDAFVFSTNNALTPSQLTQVVPEPAAWLLLVGLFSLVLMRSRSV